MTELYTSGDHSKDEKESIKQKFREVMLCLRYYIRCNDPKSIHRDDFIYDFCCYCTEQHKENTNVDFMGLQVKFITAASDFTIINKICDIVFTDPTKTTITKTEFCEIINSRDFMSKYMDSIIPSPPPSSSSAPQSASSAPQSASSAPQSAPPSAPQSAPPSPPQSAPPSAAQSEPPSASSPPPSATSPPSLPIELPEGEQLDDFYDIKIINHYEIYRKHNGMNDVRIRWKQQNTIYKNGRIFIGEKKQITDDSTGTWTGIIVSNEEITKHYDLYKSKCGTIIKPYLRWTQKNVFQQDGSIMVGCKEFIK